LEGSAGGPQNVAFSPAGGAALLTTAGGTFVLKACRINRACGEGGCPGLFQARYAVELRRENGGAEGFDGGER